MDTKIIVPADIEPLVPNQQTKAAIKVAREAELRSTMVSDLSHDSDERRNSQGNVLDSALDDVRTKKIASLTLAEFNQQIDEL